MTKRKTASRLDQIYTDEAVLLKKVIEYLEPLERRGIKVLKIRDKYTKGYSDLFICVRGRFVVAELKDDIGVASQQQKEFIRDMVACGAVGGICRTVQDVLDLISEATRDGPSG